MIKSKSKFSAITTVLPMPNALVINDTLALPQEKVDGYLKRIHEKTRESLEVTGAYDISRDINYPCEHGRGGFMYKLKCFRFRKCFSHLFLTVLISLLSVNAKPYMEVINEEYEVFSQNKKVNVKLFPFFNRGCEGITHVYLENELLYSINEYARCAIVSDDGDYLVLYRKNFDWLSNDKLLMGSNLLAIFKKGRLVKRYSAKDLFELKMNLPFESVFEIGWLGYEIVDGSVVSMKVPIKFKNKKRLLVHLGNGYDLEINLNDGRVLRKKNIRESFRWHLEYGNEKSSVEGKAKILKIKKYLSRYGKFEMDKISYSSEMEDAVFKEWFSCLLVYKKKNATIFLELRVHDFETFELMFPKIFDSLESYYKKQRKADPNFECTLGGYLIYDEENNFFFCL